MGRLDQLGQKLPLSREAEGSKVRRLCSECQSKKEELLRFCYAEVSSLVLSLSIAVLLLCGLCGSALWPLT